MDLPVASWRSPAHLTRKSKFVKFKSTLQVMSDYVLKYTPYNLTIIVFKHSVLAVYKQYLDLPSSFINGCMVSGSTDTTATIRNSFLVINPENWGDSNIINYGHKVMFVLDFSYEKKIPLMVEGFRRMNGTFGLRLTNEYKEHCDFILVHPDFTEVPEGKHVEPNDIFGIKHVKTGKFVTLQTNHFLLQTEQALELLASLEDRHDDPNLRDEDCFHFNLDATQGNNDTNTESNS